MKDVHAAVAAIDDVIGNIRERFVAWRDDCEAKWNGKAECSLCSCPFVTLVRADPPCSGGEACRCQ
jgi:hypothetical protein